MIGKKSRQRYVVFSPVITMTTLSGPYKGDNMNKLFVIAGAIFCIAGSLFAVAGYIPVGVLVICIGIIWLALSVPFREKKL